MSRDRSREDAAGRRGDADELLSAYVDGIAELSIDERRRVDAQLASAPAARADEAATRSLLDRLRALPPEGDEPDWSAMERSIRSAVGDEVPRPWWRAWRWLVPVMSCATAAAVLILLWSRPRPRPIRETAAPPVAQGERSVSAMPEPEVLDDPGAIVPLWLDGAEVDVDLSAADILRVPGIGDDDIQGDGDADGVALLPAADLGWVDRLDDAAVSRAERWLSSAPARKKS